MKSEFDPEHRSADFADTRAPALGILAGAAERRKVDIDSLFPADSPRLAGEDVEHARGLAEAGTPLPPIIVHRSTMRVIDGMHRLRAARLRGERTIEVQFFDGDPDAAFLLAVEANITHGLPLSRADREAAVTRIIAAYAHWSDRAVAVAVGLSDKTVSAIRARATSEIPQSPTRIGRDGRVRPLSTAEGRRRAHELIRACPHASLREIARAAGIAPATVRDVRARISRGEDPVPPRERGAPGAACPGRSGADRPQGAAAVAGPDPGAAIRGLMRDPSLRFTDSGRAMLRWLAGRLFASDEWSQRVDAVPQHCTNLVSELARGCANEWTRFADELDRRISN